MRAKTTAAFLVATVIVATYAIPVGASAARPHRYKQKASVSAQINLRGTNGFRVDLFTTGSGGVILHASRRTSRSGGASVDYFSFARRHAFKAGGLNLRMGRMGHFRGRFVPTRTETQSLSPECEGNPTTIESGFFVGSFDFRGEQGYTAVHSRRSRGSVTRQPAAVCTLGEELPWHESARESKEQKGQERHELHLVAGEEGASVLFDARREEGTKRSEPGQTTFLASANGKRIGDFRVNYSAFVFDLDGDAATAFQVPNLSEPLAEATITPPAPFSGSATFHLDDPKTASWTGDLAVEMPGLGKVPLTGGDIDAGLCKGLSNCTKTLPDNLQPVLEAPSGTIVAVSVSKPKRNLLRPLR